MRNLVLTVITIAAFTFATQASAKTVKFTDADGVEWTVTGGDGASVSAWHATPGAAAMCPSHHVNFEEPKNPVTTIPMTKEQKFRGDHRWHIVCVRDESTSTLVDRDEAPKPIQRQRPRDPGVIDVNSY